jgi:pSer/pThr/pTyr-binding forkhead associated (FHA) protein
MKQLSLDAFLDTCGGRQPLALDVAPPDGGTPERKVLHQPFALVGRFEASDVCLSDPAVSRRHALVQMIAGRTFCLDLGSRTGTHWQTAAEGRGWVSRQSPLQVGPYRVSVGDDPQASDPRMDRWDPWASGSIDRYDLPVATLHVLHDGSTVCQWKMNRVLAVVGNADLCKVRLRGPGVAKLHCSLVATPLGLWVIDLHRMGGIHVNRTPVNHALLEHDDCLQVGCYTIHVNYGTALAPVKALTHAADQRLQPSPGTGAMVPPVVTDGRSEAIATESLSAELLSGLLRQCSQTQQQMFEQSMVMMFRMFQSMHVEQVGLLRDELARLDELNQELRGLLTQRVDNRPLPSPAALPPAAGGQSANSRSAATGPAKQPPPQPAAAAPPAAGTTSHNSASPAKAQAGTPSPQGQDVHLWLCQRMDAIQQERQGIWDRIVGALKKSEK